MNWNLEKMTVEVPIKDSFHVDAKILGWVTWSEEPKNISSYTLAAGYKFCSATGEGKILEYAYVPDAAYKRNT